MSVPAKSFGCRNSTGFPWAPVSGSPFGLAIPQHARARGAQSVARGEDVGNLVAHVVNPALRVAFQEPAYWGIFTQRLKKLYLRV